MKQLLTESKESVTRPSTLLHDARMEAKKGLLEAGIARQRALDGQVQVRREWGRSKEQIRFEFNMIVTLT